MRKLLIAAAAFLVMSSASLASPTKCGTLGDLASGCVDTSGNFYSSLSSTLSGTLALTPITGGGLSATLDLSALAGTSNTLDFSITAPPGFNITDLSVNITGASGMTLTLNNSLFSGGSITATSGGGVVNPTFSGVSTLNLTGTLAVAAGASGTATLNISPSLTSIKPVPEPGTIGLFALGLLGLGLVYGRRMLEA